MTTHWLLCVYIGALPWPFTLRIWDAFLLEGLLCLRSSALSGAHSALSRYREGRGNSAAHAAAHSRASCGDCGPARRSEWNGSCCVAGSPSTLLLRMTLALLRVLETDVPEWPHAPKHICAKHTKRARPRTRTHTETSTYAHCAYHATGQHTMAAGARVLARGELAIIGSHSDA